MLANLKIIWQFHAHPVHQKVSRFFGPRYIGDDFFLGPNLVSFNRTVVPYEISKLTSAQKQKFLSVCQKRFNKLKNINISKQANTITFITHGFRISVVSDVRERLQDLGSPLRFMLRRSSLVECVSELHGTCLQCVECFLSISMCSHVCQKILSTHFIP